MTVAYSDFVAAFPEFSNASNYPQSQVNFWLAQAGTQLSPARFGSSLDLATMLFVAHNIVLSARAASQVPGGSVGTASGIVASKSVGPASVSYDTTLTSSQDAGYWNATSYGQRYWQMIRAFGTGPLYVGRQLGPAPVSPDVGYAFTNRNDGF